jgi:glycosyltransferase involved in cell wall biosynthesis
MRVLMLHNRYLDSGGEDWAVADDMALLKEHGHEVELLERSNQEVEQIGRARTAFNTVWSKESYRRVAKALQDGSFDVLHLHNFFPLWSPSVYYAAAHAGVPVVQTLHNYRLMCVNALLFRDGHLCEECLGKAFAWQGIAHGCYRESRSGSATVATMTGMHRLIGTWAKKVTLYIAVSEFAREKYIEGGLPPQKIVVKPNFVHPSPAPGAGGGGYALYVGRISVEKGITTMLRAWDSVSDALPLKIIGDGPLTGQVQAAAAASQKIKYLGRKPPAEVLQLMRGAEFLVFPSELYETMGRTVLESLAVGTPVVTSALGERASLVMPGQIGFHFPAGDVSALSERVKWCSQNLPEVRSLRKAARMVFERKFTGPQNLALLLSIYQHAQQQHRQAAMAIHTGDSSKLTEG